MRGKCHAGEASLMVSSDIEVVCEREESDTCRRDAGVGLRQPKCGEFQMLTNAPRRLRKSIASLEQRSSSSSATLTSLCCSSYHILPSRLHITQHVIQSAHKSPSKGPQGGPPSPLPDRSRICWSKVSRSPHRSHSFRQYIR